MKILEVDNKHAYLIPKEGTRILVKDINEENILEVTKQLIDNPEVEMDAVPEEEDCPNPAERVIYGELHKQVTALLLKRDTLLSGIEAKFEEAEKFYNQAEPFEELNWAETDVTE
ncbi:MAG: hypothetical protein RR672_00235 [Raoultibacter sp.]